MIWLVVMFAVGTLVGGAVVMLATIWSVRRYHDAIMDYHLTLSAFYALLQTGEAWDDRRRPDDGSHVQMPILRRPWWRERN